MNTTPGDQRSLKRISEITGERYERKKSFIENPVCRLILSGILAAEKHDGLQGLVK